jgi:hypothetical protein
MQHPQFIRRIHRFFNPPRLAAMRDAEKLKAAHHNGMDEEIERLRNPDDFKIWKVYATLGGAVIAAVVVVALIVLR